MLARELRTVSDASGLLRVSRRLDIDTRSAARQDEHVMGGHVVALVIIVGLPAMATARDHAPCPPTVHRALPLRVVDGDTFRLHGERIRILGIDTPERGEPGSGRATYRLLALLRSGNVVIVRHGKDVYCRTLYAKPLPTARRPRRPAATTPPNVPRGAGQSTGRLAGLHCDRRHGADAGALDAIEVRDGARRHIDATAIGLGQRDPVATAEQAARRNHYEIAAGLEDLRRDLREMRLRGGFHDQIARRDEVLERQERWRGLERGQEGFARRAAPRHGAAEA